MIYNNPVHRSSDNDAVGRRARVQGPTTEELLSRIAEVDTYPPTLTVRAAGRASLVRRPLGVTEEAAILASSPAGSAGTVVALVQAAIQGLEVTTRSNITGATMAFIVTR